MTLNDFLDALEANHRKWRPGMRHPDWSVRAVARMSYECGRDMIVHDFTMASLREVLGTR